MSSHVLNILLYFSIYFQEGPKSISVWKLENRTTCAVEAINGVIGRGIPGSSNFFNFVHFLQRFELARGIKFRNLYGRCLIKKRKTKSSERSTLIRNATELLEAGSISVNEFLDSIANMKTKENSLKTTTTTKDNKRVAISSDSESENDEGVTSTQNSTSKRARTCVNACRMCEIRSSNVILFPCAHAVICSECWAKKTVLNDKYCVTCFEPVSNAQQF